MNAPDRRQTPRPDHIDDRTVIEKYEDDCRAVARANVAARKGGAAMTDTYDPLTPDEAARIRDAYQAEIDDHDLFLEAMTDLLDVMRIDMLPVPINIGWKPAEWGNYNHNPDDIRIVVPGGLQIQIDDKDAERWMASMVLDVFPTGLSIDQPVVRVTGRLDGRRTTVTIYYVGRPS